MKNIILTLLFILFFSIGINLVSAKTTKSIIFKKIILSRYNIKKQYTNGKEMNKKISTFFIKLKLKGKTAKENKLNILRKRLSKKLSYLSKKDNLTYKEKKLRNLIYNLYLRTILELDY